MRNRYSRKAAGTGLVQSLDDKLHVPSTGPLDKLQDGSLEIVGTGAHNSEVLLFDLVDRFG